GPNLPRARCVGKFPTKRQAGWRRLWVENAGFVPWMLQERVMNAVATPRPLGYYSPLQNLPSRRIAPPFGANFNYAINRPAETSEHQNPPRCKEQNRSDNRAGELAGRKGRGEGAEEGAGSGAGCRADRHHRHR